MDYFKKSSVLAHYAYVGNLEAVKILLDQGYPAYSILEESRDDGHSITPVHEAVRGQHAEVCRVLCEAAKNYIKTSDILCYAMRLQNEGAFRILVETGAKVNVADRFGDTPLHWIAGGFRATNI